MNSPSSRFANYRILSHPPMELTDEEKKQFAAMWDNVPPENIVTLNSEDSRAFVEKLLSNDDQATKGMQRLWQHSENYLQQLRKEVHEKMGIPKHLVEGDLPPNV